jgi:hypothetical protein
MRVRNFGQRPLRPQGHRLLETPTVDHETARAVPRVRPPEKTTDARDLQ